LEEGKKCSHKLVMMKGAQYLKTIPEWWRKSDIKSKRKFHSWTVHESTERERESRTIALLSSNNEINKCTNLKIIFLHTICHNSDMFLPSQLSLFGGWVANATPRLLNLGQRPDTHYIGSWEGPRTGLSACGKCQPPRIRSLERILTMTKLKIFRP